MNMKIAYKGFDAKLSCKGEIFTVGQVYSKVSNGSKPRLCTSDGYHYGLTLKDAVRWYPLTNGNRYCKIEVLGDFTEDSTKGITTSFKVLEEIPQHDVKRHLAIQEMNLDTLKAFQTKYPLSHVGGSVGLFLHGYWLERWSKAPGSDFDIIMPYYINMHEEDLTVSEGKKAQMVEIGDKASGNDFDQTVLIDGIKVDIRIDPKQRYRKIIYEGFEFKVSEEWAIIEAKFRYANQGNNKHKNDLLEMMKGPKKPESISKMFASESF